MTRGPLRRSRRLQNKEDAARRLEAERNLADQRGDDDFNCEEFIWQELEAERQEKEEESDAEAIADKIILEMLYLEDPSRLVSRACNPGRWTGSDLL